MIDNDQIGGIMTNIGGRDRLKKGRQMDQVPIGADAAMASSMNIENGELKQEQSSAVGATQELGGASQLAGEIEHLKKMKESPKDSDMQFKQSSSAVKDSQVSSAKRKR